MSGTGKSHIAISIGYLACSMNLRVRYTTSANMLRALHVASVIDDLVDTLKDYERPDLLIIDEVGLDRRERDTKHDADLFYTVVSSRYERQLSTIVTTNINWEDCHEERGLFVDVELRSNINILPAFFIQEKPLPVNNPG